MIVGYARVSTEEQKLDLQVQALENVGCEVIFQDHGQSGAQFGRAGLEAALRQLEPGGTLVVWRLDRLGRSLSGLVGLMEQLGERDIHFRSVTENIDTASSGGKLMFHMMAALAEFERSIISERTKAGMAAAKVRGSRIGRPRAISEDEIHVARCAVLCQRADIHEVAQNLNVSVRTLQRRITERPMTVLSSSGFQDREPFFNERGQRLCRLCADDRMPNPKQTCQVIHQGELK